MHSHIPTAADGGFIFICRTISRQPIVAMFYDITGRRPRAPDVTPPAGTPVRPADKAGHYKFLHVTDKIKWCWFLSCWGKLWGPWRDYGWGAGDIVLFCFVWIILFFWVSRWNLLNPSRNTFRWLVKWRLASSFWQDFEARQSC